MAFCYVRTYILWFLLKNSAMGNMGLSTGYSPFLSGPKPVGRTTTESEWMKSTRLYGWMGLQATFQHHRRTLVQHIVLIMADPRSKSGSVFFDLTNRSSKKMLQKKENGPWWSTTIFFLHPKLMISHVKVCVLQYGSHDRVGFTPTVLWCPRQGTYVYVVKVIDYCTGLREAGRKPAGGKNPMIRSVFWYPESTVWLKGKQQHMQHHQSKQWSLARAWFQGKARNSSALLLEDKHLAPNICRKQIYGSCMVHHNHCNPYIYRVQCVSIKRVPIQKLYIVQNRW